MDVETVGSESINEGAERALVARRKGTVFDDDNADPRDTRLRRESVQIVEQATNVVAGLCVGDEPDHHTDSPRRRQEWRNVRHADFWRLQTPTEPLVRSIRGLISGIFVEVISVLSPESSQTVELRR